MMESAKKIRGASRLCFPLGFARGVFEQRRLTPPAKGKKIKNQKLRGLPREIPKGYGTYGTEVTL